MSDITKLKVKAILKNPFENDRERDYVEFSNGLSVYRGRLENPQVGDVFEFEVDNSILENPNRIPFIFGKIISVRKLISNEHHRLEPK